MGEEERQRMGEERRGGERSFALPTGPPRTPYDFLFRYLGSDFRLHLPASEPDGFRLLVLHIPATPILPSLAEKVSVSESEGHHIRGAGQHENMQRSRGPAL